MVCGHGTAIGALDEDALFYLRARGIPESEARNLLVRAFLEDALEGFADEDRCTTRCGARSMNLWPLSMGAQP